MTNLRVTGFDLQVTGYELKIIMQYLKTLSCITGKYFFLEIILAYLTDMERLFMIIKSTKLVDYV